MLQCTRSTFQDCVCKQSHVFLIPTEESKALKKITTHRHARYKDEQRLKTTKATLQTSNTTLQTTVKTTEATLQISNITLQTTLKTTKATLQTTLKTTLEITQKTTTATVRTT